MNTAQLSTLTKELIRFRSTATRPQEIERCADFIEAFFKDTHYIVERIVHNTITSLLITTGTKKPSIFLCGHFDVVEGEDDQFMPQERNGKLYGRGACDMKSGIAAMMQLMKDIEDTNQHIGLMLTSDEEQGGFDGVNHLLQQGYSCNAAIIPDGGYAIDKLVTKSKGVLWLKIQAQGIAAHASKPWLGQNAITVLMEGLHRLEEMFRDVNARADAWHTTCSINRIEGGKATNQIPDMATAYCDIRLTEDDAPEKILDLIRIAMPTGVQVSVLCNEPGTTVDPTNVYIHAFEEAIRSVGKTPTYIAEHGSTDARFFSQQNIPVLVAQPEGGNPHALDEWVDIQSIAQYYTVLRQFCMHIPRIYKKSPI